MEELARFNSVIERFFRVMEQEGRASSDGGFEFANLVYIFSFWGSTQIHREPQHLPDFIARGSLHPLITVGIKKVVADLPVFARSRLMLHGTNSGILENYLNNLDWMDLRGTQD